jgi:hypothetical protein
LLSACSDPFRTPPRSPRVPGQKGCGVSGARHFHPRSEKGILDTGAMLLAYHCSRHALSAEGPKMPAHQVTNMSGWLLAFGARGSVGLVLTSARHEK